MAANFDAIDYLSLALGLFFAVANLSFGILLGFSSIQIITLRRSRSEIHRKMAVFRLRSSQVPKISIVMPAYNEAVVIVQSVRSFLALDYGHLEVVVVNDGSSDSTFKILDESFNLKRCDRKAHVRLGNASIRRIYQSQVHPNLYVIDQFNAGKAAALNSGISFADSDLVCCVDADTIPERDCLLRAVIPILENPHEIVAAGGVLRVFNGCQLENGTVRRGVLPRKLLSAFQVVEYIRAFFAGRIGWESIGATVLISGAFTLFNRHALVAGGGYRENDVTEDFEVILRIRGALMRAGRRCRVAIIPDPLCWTQVPDNWRDLGRQRRRWQMGAVLTIRRHWPMIFNPRHGTVGLCVLPYMLLFEIIAPIAELFGYAVLTLQLIRGAVGWELLSIGLGVGILYSTFITMMAAYLEESYFARNQRRRYFFWFLGVSLLENFGYRQMQLLWRLQGVWRALSSNSEWGAHTRREFARTISHPNPNLPSEPGADHPPSNQNAG